MSVFVCYRRQLTCHFQARGIAPGSTLPARVVETEIEPLRLYSDSGELDQVYFQCGEEAAAGEGSYC